MGKNADVCPSIRMRPCAKMAHRSSPPGLMRPSGCPRIKRAPVLRSALRCPMITNPIRFSDSSSCGKAPPPNARSPLVPNFLFRARAGQPTGLGEASIGLQAVKASTPFTVTEDFITMAAPETAHQAASVRFTITPTPDVFPTQQQGDAVNFGIFRGDRATYGDTCDAELGIAGISIVYTKKTPGAHEMSEDSSED